MNDEKLNTFLLMQEAMDHFYKRIRGVNDKQYWHYTSLGAVLNIFSDYIDSQNDSIDSLKLWASNIRYMNDAEEFMDGKYFFEDMQRKKHAPKEEIDKSNIDGDIYLISLCEAGDLLSQWKWYGKQSGVSFRINNIKDIGYITNSSKRFDTHTRPLPVHYLPKEKRRYFDKLNKSGYRKIIAPLFIPFCKNASFSEERESRLVFFAPHAFEEASMKFNIIYNKTDPDRIKPALEVTLSNKIPQNRKNHKNELIRQSIVSEMIVGPGENQELVFNNLIHAFDRKNYNYQAFSDVEEKELKIDDLKADRKTHRVVFLDEETKEKTYRDCYKCENGLIIMRSTIPFRG